MLVCTIRCFFGSTFMGRQTLFFYDIPTLLTLFSSGLQMWVNMKPYSIQTYNRKATHYMIGISDKKNLIDQQRETILVKPGNEISIQVLPRSSFSVLNVGSCPIQHETYLKMKRK